MNAAKIEQLITEGNNRLFELREGAFEQLVKTTFGDNLPSEGEWCRVHFQQNLDIIALVPADEVNNRDLYERVMKGEFPYASISFTVNGKLQDFGGQN